jgi:hypothetical protein
MFRWFFLLGCAAACTAFAGGPSQTVLHITHRVRAPAALPVAMRGHAPDRLDSGAVSRSAALKRSVRAPAPARPAPAPSPGAVRRGCVLFTHSLASFALVLARVAGLL